MKVLSPRIVAIPVVLCFLAASILISQRSFVAQARESFALFPMRIGSWTGHSEELSSQIVEALKVEDYLFANYSQGGDGQSVNFYVAYYMAQGLGSAAHSPRTCIPGGGWEIDELSRAALNLKGTSLVVNRAIISKGSSRQLVYYWFDQRGRVLASEYAVKWYLLVDGVIKSRTDGALVRLVTPIDGRDVGAADQRLQQFATDTYPRLQPFVPR